MHKFYPKQLWVKYMELMILNFYIHTLLLNSLHVILRRQGSSIIMRYYYVYILASKRNGTLYIGVTHNLLKRVKEHKDKIVKGLHKNIISIC